jgi:hypothetical protein
VVVTGALALTAEGESPIPPLAVVIPVEAVLGIVAAVLILVLGAAALLARRAYGRATLGERRTSGAPTQPWVASSERLDG